MPTCLQFSPISQFLELLEPDFSLRPKTLLVTQREGIKGRSMPLSLPHSTPALSTVHISLHLQCLSSPVKYSFGTMAEVMERYRAKVNFRHKFQNVKQKFPNGQTIHSPTFFARNIPFFVDLERKEYVIYSSLLCANERMKKGFSFNLEYRLSLITPSKAIQSEEFSCTFNDANFYHKTVLSELFPGEEMLVDDAVTLDVSLWVDEPEGTDFTSPKEKLRQSLLTQENWAHSKAFATLLESRDLSKVTFIVTEDSSKVEAQKTILTERSFVFSEKWTRDNEIIVDDMGAVALKLMLRYIYTGELRFPKGVKIDLKICQELVKAGEKYNLQNFKEYATMAMTEFVSLENAWELLSFATQFKAKAATKALGVYYGEYLHKIKEKM